MIHNLKMPIKETDLNEAGALKPSSILYYAQEAAGAHAVELGTGWEELQKKHLFWAVIRTRVEIFDKPTGNEVTLKTWPMPTSRTAYPRCVEGYDGDKLLFKVLSLWVLMDTETRAMVLPGKSGVPVMGTTVGTEPAMPRSLPVTESEQVIHKTVEKIHLDRNGHMNNTRYMDWVMDLLSAEKTVKGFELCYLNEGRLGECMELGYTLDEDTLTVNIHRIRTDVTDKKDRIFAAVVQI